MAKQYDTHECEIPMSYMNAIYEYHIPMPYMNGIPTYKYIHTYRYVDSSRETNE